ncbi:Ger(x)C family spore germination protein [Domibacillus sp. DTU_2020_1001157_1_SI_ALB_TIR_016]|uniref:Ger(x)C family spore germination protein n=1 Tax=Domibacillus sp. DTU_2020_1001157_1_SI_ALB_TIR_016 TaxID=3077789 RepID=UPI0028E3419A|nr:Ger(x)C family spore germination protein [Domibacillus sp. DTU_2020_1001157_1_SI_ALB_TIR_016]WNS78949.1 Ger(x)C family spore germination protein [Domibacillus sp. DTU_2020_1001157_1_SI_ALB_TIR_016]
MNRKRTFLFGLLASLSVFTSGCWSERQLTDIALVAAVGIDRTEDGQYEASYQFFNPGNVAGGLQGGGGGQSPPVAVYTATGDTIMEVHGNMSRKVSREPYYSHTNLVVVSEEIAKTEGIAPVLEAFDRGSQFRVTTSVVIARHVKAKELITTLTALDKVPSQKIMQTLESTEKALGENINIDLEEIITALVSPGREPMVSGFTIKGDPKAGTKQESLQSTEMPAAVEADGNAIFKNGKLVGWIQGTDARGALWVLDRIQSTTITTPWAGQKDAISYRVVRQKTNVSADMKEGKPHISVHVHMEGDIGEVIEPVNLTDPKTLEKIEDNISKQVKSEIETSIRHTKKKKADIFAFGDVFHRAEPKEWKKIEKKWEDEIFPNLAVDVSVESYVRRTGLRNNSYLSEMKSVKE